MAWAGQLIAGVLFREQADRAALQAWIPMGLCAYALWHLLKTFTARPIEPYEWTETEREVLLAAPLGRRDLIMSRLKRVVFSATFKAIVFAFAMLPDLKVWPLGFLGMLLALTLLDLIRMAAEITAWSLPPQQRKRVRLAILTVASGGFISALTITLIDWSTKPTTQPAALGLGLGFIHSCIALGNTAPGHIAQLPFQPFATVILAFPSPAMITLALASCCGMVIGSAYGLLRLDSYCMARRAANERALFAKLNQATAHNAMLPNTCHSEAPGNSPSGNRATGPWQCFAQSAVLPVRVPLFANGAGLLLWRQLLGIRHYPLSVLVAMAVPLVLSLLPLLTRGTTAWLIAQLIGSLVFYSFLLLPAALRFDFRRDVDRMGVLRALPISPLAATLGQLAAPVISCTAFQATTMLVAMAIRPYPFTWFLMSVFLFVPVNLLIFGLENIVFLLFPYRHNQEGLNVFFRSILTFTAKGLLFMAGAIVTGCWALATRSLANHFADVPFAPDMRWVFALGMWIITAATGAIMIGLIARLYARFDPSRDVPPMS